MADERTKPEVPSLEQLLTNLRAEPPVEYEEDRLVQSEQTPVAELRMDMERWSAVETLARMGTNAWPAVPSLAAALKYPNLSVGIAAASVLARIQVDEHPEWGGLQEALDDDANAASLFRYLLSGRDRFGQGFDRVHRRFALVGLAGVGPLAKDSVPDLVRLIQTKEDCELWVPAALALGSIGTAGKEFVPSLQRFLQDQDEWPKIRVAAAQALAAVVPEQPDTRLLLRHALEDERSLVRIGAARALWRLNAPAEEVLLTLTALLGHKLVSIRIAALDGIADLGSSAQASRAAVERLISDQDESVRRAALAALHRIDVPASRSAHAAEQLVAFSTLPAGDELLIRFVNAHCRIDLRFVRSTNSTGGFLSLDREERAGKLIPIEPNASERRMTLTKSEVDGLDDLLRFYRSKARYAGCLDKNEVTFSRKRNGRIVATERFNDRSCYVGLPDGVNTLDNYVSLFGLEGNKQ